MTEQQYRAHACNNTEPHEPHEFRGTYRKPSLPGVEITETFRCDGIERPVPTTCICGPQSVISDGPNVDCPIHGEHASEPMREQIAELLWSEAAEDGDDPRWTWAYLTERADRNEGDYADIRAEYYRTADAVLALIQNGADR